MPSPRMISFMLSESVQQMPTQNGVPMMALISPMVMIQPPYIPGMYSFSVTMGFYDVDINIKNKLTSQMRAPGGKIVAQSEMEFQVTANGLHLPESNGIIMNADLRNVVLEVDGVYKFIACINDKVVGEYDIPVYQPKAR